MNRTRFSILLLAVLLLIVCSKALGTPSESSRYPYDPVCAWGRISNGRGLLLRCLTKDESERLSKAQAPAPTASSGASSSNDLARTAPVAATTEPLDTKPSASANSGVPSSTAPVSADSLQVELVGVTADEGELPVAKKKLSAPLDRYAQCVANHGGLTATSALVEVRFLVRERGRAEGVTVSKFQGLGEAAAACIAQVIDRRPTGVPEAPVVGATATIRVRKRTTK